jgi:hypothetical protein
MLPRRRSIRRPRRTPDPRSPTSISHAIAEQPASWEEAMLRNDLPTAWAIADRVLAARDPLTRDEAGRPYHQRWVWDGRPFDGHGVVVRCYHGLGDTLQFARYLPVLRARAAHVTLEVQPDLVDLLQGCGADRVARFDPAAPLPAEHDVEIMELAHALRAVPSGARYLRVPPAPVPGASTGVCWQAGGWNPARSIPLDELRPVLPAGAVSLQRGASGPPDPLCGAMDVRATARLIAGLDRVITVDTMVAHLAGALGCRVHLLLRAQADWRWGRADRTPWYANTRIHRQRHEGDWRHALQSLAAALRAEG